MGLKKREIPDQFCKHRWCDVAKCRNKGIHAIQIPGEQMQDGAPLLAMVCCSHADKKITADMLRFMRMMFCIHSESLKDFCRPCGRRSMDHSLGINRETI